MVTGAAHGIGRATARALIAAGYAVIGCDVDEAGLASAAQELGQGFLGLRADISSPTDIDALYDAPAVRSANLRHLVNNAGIYLARKLADYTPEATERVMRVNVMGPAWMAQRFVRQAPPGFQGSIVNVASVCAFDGSSDPLYGAAKSALIGLSKCLAIELAPHIRVNAVAPGVVETEMMKHIPPSRLTAYRERELLDEPISACAVADSVLFLISSKARHYTGAVLDINNGGYLR
jgi:3-oxoacyl-[acyl-carrier protein] reductase